MISGIVLLLVLSQECPPDNVPPTCGGKQSIGGTSVGDPVDFAQGTPTGYVSRTDLALQSEIGTIAFKRTVATRWAPSELPYFDGNSSFYSGVTKPFGGLPADTGMYWWHSWMAVIQPGVFHGYNENTNVRTSSGRWVSFAATPRDCGTELYLDLDDNQLRESLRLSCSGEGSKISYSLVEEDGRELLFDYEKRWEESGRPTRNYLSEIRRDGRTETTFTYGAPLDTAGAQLACTGGSAPQSLPFLRWAEFPAVGRRLEFRYVALSGACPIKELRLTDLAGANARTVASYEYGTGANGGIELRTVSKDYGYQPSLGFQWGPSNFETYCGYGSDFRALAGLWPGCAAGQGGEPTNRFVLNASKLVTQASTPSEQFDITLQGKTQASVDWLRSSGTNETLPSFMSVNQAFTLQPTSYHNGYAQSEIFSCSTPISCRGTTQPPSIPGCVNCSVYRRMDASAPTADRYLTGTTSSFSLYVDQGGMRLPSLTQSGGTLDPGPGTCTGPLCTKLTWAFPGVAPKPTSERRASVVLAGAEAEISSWYHPNGLLAKRVEKGWTKTLAGSVVEKAYATFYRLQPLCAGAAAYTDRIVEVEGPCEVDPATSTSANQCNTVVRPVVHYTYHGNGSGNDKGRLASIRRYPNGCGGSVALVSAFSGYLESGYPTYVSDENGQLSMELRDTEGRVLYSEVAGVAWSNVYENEKLIRTVNPSGLNTIYCYRNSTVRPGTPPFTAAHCNGEWTGRLEWVATTQGNAHAGATNFFEAVEYAYGGARTLRTRTFVKRSEGIRRVEVVDVDGRGNPVFAGSGSIANPIADVARFDAANLPVARGAAFNKPSALCGASDTPDTKCTTLGYDSAGRAISVVIPLATSVNETNGIAYDAQGNVCEINTAGAAQCGNTTGGGQSRLSYEHDDFGNLVRAYLPGTADVSYTGAKGAHRREYTASGSLVQAQTPEMFAQGETQVYTRDALGRLLTTSVSSSSGTMSINSFVYDDPVYSPCDGLLQTNVRGRVAYEYDPSGITFYSYDPLGRVTSEGRWWYNAAFRCTTVRYAYRADGQVERITYPSGLEAHYVFDWTHRVSTVELSQGTPLLGPWTAVWNATWEPFGGLAGYYSQGVWLSYQLGQTQASWNGTSWVPPANGQGCPATTSTTPDGTGLPAKLVARNPASGASLLVEEYSWAADQLLKAKRCYNGNNGGAPALETAYQYDTGRRLVQAASAAGGGLGPIGTEVWNRTPVATTNERGVATLAYKYRFGATAGRFASASPNDVASLYQNLNRAKPKQRSYLFDRDGRMGAEYYSQYPGPRPANNCSVPGDVCSGSAPCCSPYWCEPTDPATSDEGLCRPSGQPQYGNARIDTWSKFAPGSLNTMATQVSIFERNAPLNWQYAFDSQNRRRVKTSPSGRRSFFTYSASKQLLEEAREGATPGAPETIEEYVYLGGQPVVISRAMYNRSTNQRDSSSTNCGEMLHDVGQVSCGWRYPVFDPVVGKATAIMDSSQRIVWTGEYQPMGARNRQEYWGGVYDYNGPGSAAWPGYVSTTARDQDIAVPTQLRAGLDMKLRVRFALFDMKPGGQDSVRIRNSYNQEVWSGYGFEYGAFRTSWFPMSTDVFGVKFVSAAAPQDTHWYAGAHMEGYEWTRFTPGSEAYGTPLGFLGMYYDEETEKYENWNREYDPFTGNYLSSEPMLQEPKFVVDMATQALPLQTYSYANSNPISNSDPNGLWTLNGRCEGFSTALALARLWLGCDTQTRSRPDDLTCGAVPNSCETAKRCFGSCDICAMLGEGTWPTATPVGPVVRPRGFPWYAEWTDPWIESDGTYTTTSGGQWDLYRWQCAPRFVATLAGTLIHEATHACAVGATAQAASAFADEVRTRSCSGWNVECNCVPKEFRHKSCH